LNTEDIGGSVQIDLNFENDQYLLFDSTDSACIDLTKVTAVYFRRPEINNSFEDLSSGEQSFIRSELLFTLEGLYKILHKAFWINDVYAIRNAENKIYQLLIAKELGFIIPKSVITNIPKRAQKFDNSNKETGCIIKPIKSGLVEGHDEQGVIFTSKVVINEATSERVVRCPVFLQNLVSKIGDVRVTVIGKKIFAALIHSQGIKDAEVDWRKSLDPLKHTIIELPDDVSKKCLALTKALSLNFAAIDFILNKENDFIFLEINPNGQWAWIEKRLNLRLSDELTELLVKNR